MDSPLNAPSFHFEGRVAQCLPQLLAAWEALPKEVEIQQHVADAAAATERGYFLPDEDERLREVFARYLAVRASLHDCVQQLSFEAHLLSQQEKLPTFAVAYAAACVLVRAADFIVDFAAESDVVRQKLDEPEPRYGLEAKAFTRIYRSLTSPKHRWAFYHAMQYFKAQREAIVALPEALPELTPVVALLQRESELLADWQADFISTRWRYRFYSFLRRHRSGYRKTMFQLFKLSGTIIADLKQPSAKPLNAPKRVTPEIRQRLEDFLLPGDLLVTRHDDALSNLFLPGFWPHAVFCLGRPEKRAEWGITPSPALDPAIRFVEAKKDGVRLRPPEDTLALDAFTILRPRLAPSELAEVVARATSHAGKLYDFVFDFSTADRLACTELVYRAYHGVGAVAFSLQPHAGRQCLSAEDLLNQAIGEGWFEPVVVYGVRGDDWVEGAEARGLLAASYQSTF